MMYMDSLFSQGVLFCQYLFLLGILLQYGVFYVASSFQSSNNLKALHKEVLLNILYII
jgi:hypothetical protein